MVISCELTKKNTDWMGFRCMSNWFMLICDSQVGLELVDCFGLCGIYRNNTVTIVDGVNESNRHKRGPTLYGEMMITLRSQMASCEEHQTIACGSFLSCRFEYQRVISWNLWFSNMFRQFFRPKNCVPGWTWDISFRQCLMGKIYHIQVLSEVQMDLAVFEFKGNPTFSW